jgi:hypothetical protein
MQTTSPPSPLENTKYTKFTPQYKTKHKIVVI